MSIFFGAALPGFNTVISVASFDNYFARLEDGALYSCEAKDNFWHVSFVEKLKEDFINLNCSNFDFSKQFFFIDNIDQYSVSESTRINALNRTNSFTRTHPDYRANFSVRSLEGAVSSYQSEYPFEMLKVRSSIVSNCGVLTSRIGENYLVLVSIIDKPVIHDFQCAIVDKRSGASLTTFTAYTNRVTVYKLDDCCISGNCYFYAKGYPVIPIYLNSADGGLSFEHTHPPHETFVGDFRKVLVDFKNGF